MNARNHSAWRGPGVLLGATLLLVGLAYVSALSVPFVWDDHELIEENTRLDSLADIPGLFAGHLWSNAETRREGAYYRPLVQASYTVDASLWDRAPLGFHATNIAIHLFVCALVFGLARRCGARPEAAAAAALCFGLMPRLSETVTWISGRTDLFASGFALLSVWLYTAEPRTRGVRLGAGVALLAGLLCKEVALAVVPAMALLTWWRPIAARRSPDWAPLLGAVVVYGLLRLAGGVGLESGLDLPWLARAGFAIEAIGDYALMIANPFSPQLLPRALGVSRPESAAAGVVVLAALAWLGLVRARRSGAPLPPLPLALCAVAVGAIAPVLHVIPIPQPALVADRFLYLPLAAGMAAAALALDRALGWRPRVAAAAIVILALLLGLTLDRRNRLWQDEVALFEHSVAHSRGDLGYARIALGAALARRGRLEEAIAAYTSAIGSQRAYAAAHPGAPVSRHALADLALLQSELGRFDAALPLLAEVLREDDDNPRLHVYYGIALARHLDFAAADRAFARALALHGDYALARNLRDQTRTAAAILARLPANPDRHPDATAIRAERARAMHLLGRVEVADALFVEVLAAPDVTPALVARARETLAQQRHVLGETPDTRRLAEALDRHPAPLAVDRPAHSGS